MSPKPLQPSEMWRGSTTAVISGINLYQPLVLALLSLVHRRTESTAQKLGWAWLSSRSLWAELSQGGVCIVGVLLAQEERGVSCVILAPSSPAAHSSQRSHSPKDHL